MRSLNLLQLLVLCVLLAVGGGFLYMRFRAWRGEEDPYFLWLLALGIGTMFGFVADHRKHGLAVVLIAVISALGCCVSGNLWIASLERSAITLEFDRSKLESDDFYVALEAYLQKYKDDSVAPAFTEMADRSYFSDAEWKDAESRWANKSPAEQNLVREEWKSDFESLGRIGDEGISNVLFAPWNWYTYGSSALIAAGVVLVIQREAHRQKLEA